MKHLGKKTAARAATLLTVFTLNANEANEKNIDLEVLNTQGVEITIPAATAEQTNDATFTGFNGAVENEIEPFVGDGDVIKASFGTASEYSYDNDSMVIHYIGPEFAEEEMEKLARETREIYQKLDSKVEVFYHPDSRYKNVAVLMLLGREANGVAGVKRLELQDGTKFFPHELVNNRAKDFYGGYLKYKQKRNSNAIAQRYEK